MFRLRFPLQPSPEEPVMIPMPAPPKLGAIQTTSPLLGDYRVATIWASIMERSYAEAREKLLKSLQDDLRLDQTLLMQVIAEVPCLVDIKEGKTKREEESIRRAQRRMAATFAGLVDRLVRYRPESRSYGLDWLVQELVNWRPIYRDYVCNTFRSPEAHETDKPKRRKGGGGGIADWGKTKPFWCVVCGYGFMSPQSVRDHYQRTGHGNESTPIGSKGLTEKQKGDEGA